ncbi:MAG: hypothetical protein AB1705_10995 [Verrucomicrobiota bacterium]
MTQRANTISSRARQVARLLALGAVFCAVSAWGCSVPVFRYALERWAADPYQAFVLHRGPLSAPDQSLVHELEKAADTLHANVSLRTVDVAQKSELLELAPPGKPLPWVVVKYPVATRLPGIVWSGPLGEAAQQLFDSPARKEIVHRLAQGESAVWVLLESGDPQKDDAAEQLLVSRLAYLLATLKLPKLDAQDVVNGLISIPEADLRLEFSSLRISRTDPAEQAFVPMLLGTEADLKSAHQPIIFPVFGRGRALYALVGSGIKTETIDQAATFLIGKCSCQVKEQNPGVDLLLAADWDSLIKTQFNPNLDLPTLAQLTNDAPVTVKIGTGEAQAAPPAAEGPAAFTGNRLIVVALAAGLLLASIFLWRRK